MQRAYKKSIALFLAIMMLLSGITLFNVSAENIVPDFETKTDTLLLVDLNTDSVVFEKNADVVRAPASITKIMTYIVVAEQVKNLDKTMVEIKSSVLKELDGTDSSVAGLENHMGEKFSVLELLNAMMIPSGSDAAVVLADFVGGSTSKFSQLMNQKAKELGCKNTNFVNSYGYAGSNHYTTANDLYKIAKYALTMPYFEDVVNTTSYTLKGDTVPLFTTNYLIDRVNGGQYYYQYAKGIKTGSTDEAGRCIVSTAQKGESRYMCIALHAGFDTVNNAMVDSKNLYEWAFDNFTDNINISVDTRFKSVQIGEKIQVKANIEYSSISENPQIKWTSSNTQVATVDQNGVVTGVSMGEAQIKAETQTGNFDICSVSCGYYSGIDVSSRYGDYTSGEKEPIDWQALKNQGIDFAIIRAGWGWEDYPTQNDADFVENVKGAVNNGISFGINFISYAVDKQTAKLEAEYLLKELNEYIPEYTKYMALPVAYNMNDSHFETNTPEQNNEIALEFARVMKENGYNTMVYADKSVFSNMNLSELKGNGIGLWYAYYPYEVDFSEKITISGTDITPDVWQYRTDWYLPFASENGYARQSLIYMLSTTFEKYAPTVVEASQKRGEKVVNISWEPVSYEISGYNVYRTPYSAYGEIDMTKLEKVASVDSNTTNYTDNNLNWFDSYYYFVAATVTDFLDKTFTKEIISTNNPYAYVKNPSPDFNSQEEFEEALQKIFRANELEIVRMIKEQREQTVEDKYVTLYSNCGPTSVAFQKVLADNGIYAEDRSAPYYTGGRGGHEYNLIRINFGENKDKVYNIVADCTYRQFMRDYFKNVLAENSNTQPTDNQIDKAMLNSQLPMVLVYEYGDFENLDLKINGLLSESGYTVTFSVEGNLKSRYERLTYPDQALQKNYSQYVTKSQVDKIKNSGFLNKPYETDLYINNSENKTNVAELEYKENGIYQCVVSAENLGIKDNEDFSFTITDKSGKTVYGAGENSEILTPFNNSHYSFMSYKEQIFLNGSSTESIKSNMEMRDNVLIRIDVRAGVDKPLISMFTVNETRIYGDVDGDNIVTVKDVTLLQLYLANYEKGLSEKDLIAANVLESDELDIKSATAIQIHLANLIVSSKTGGKIYFVDFDINYIN